MQNTVDLCQELFQSGRLERRGRHRLNGRPNVNEDWIFLRNDPPYTRLEEHSSGNTMLKRYLAKMGENLENTGKSFHALRRSVGSWMTKKCTPLPVIAEFLGHRNTESTKSYLLYDKENMRKCCLGLDDIPVLKEGSIYNTG